MADTRQASMFDLLDRPAPPVAPARAPDPEPTPEEWRFEWRGLSVIGTPGPCFRIDKERHPPGTPCFSTTGFRSFNCDAWALAGKADGRSLVEWSIAVLDAYLAAPAKHGNGLGGQLVPWKPLDFGKAAPEPAPAPIEDDPDALHPLHEQLIAAGLITRYHAVTGATLQDPQHGERDAPWNAPSRLFMFPCSLHLPEDGKPARLLIWSPRIAEHPFVREVAAVTGLEPVMADGSDAWGHSQRHGIYHHAVDLIAKGKWQLLLDLREFTDKDAIAAGINYGLLYGHLSPREALTLLAAIGIAKPSDPSPIDALRGVDLTEFQGEKGKRQRSVNFLHGPGRDANLWALIAGLERGWFVRDKSGHLTWTDRAKAEQRDLRLAAGMAVKAEPVPEGMLL